MPILERDPWRMQYFDSVVCAQGVIIPTDDGDAYALFPEHRWVYNKLLICETQGLRHGLHGMEPPEFPVFSKPVYNMRGMGAGSRVLRSLNDYRAHQVAGHMWMPLLEGDHVSTDVAVVDGAPKWWGHAVGEALKGGMFDHWTVLAESRPALEDYCGDWLERHVQGYTGMMNFETVGGTIIEVHLRFSDQWPDLYGKGWLDSLVRLYSEGRWEYADTDRRDGYSVVLFGAHRRKYAHPAPDLVRELLATPGVSSVQITFQEDRPPGVHSMPPGGFRLAIVNCWDLNVGTAIRERLASFFWATQRPIERRSTHQGKPQKLRTLDDVVRQEEEPRSGTRSHR